MKPFQPLARSITLAAVLLGGSFGLAQVLDFDPTSEGPWSDIENTTLTVPLVPNDTLTLDGSASSAEYGGFAGVEIVPGQNAWILDFPADRAWDSPEDSSFTYWLAHDETYFYVGVGVKDDVVTSDDENAAFWKDDSIEIVIDSQNDRYDENTDNTDNPYGGHCYVNFEGRFSKWDEATETTGTLWCTGVEWTYGEEGDIYGVGGAVDGGWQMEVRFNKRLFENPDTGNKLKDDYVMGFNIGLDDDDKQGIGPEGSGARTQDLELQYFWANRARPVGWNADEAIYYTEEEIANRAFMEDPYYQPLTIDSNGRLTHGGTGEIVFSMEGETPPPPQDVVVSISLTGDDNDKVTITWDGAGTLKKADAVTGPYETVAGATSPYEIPVEGPAAYYIIEN